MEEAARNFVDSLNACFHGLPDPRGQASCEHRLMDILAINILAVTCWADDWTDIEPSVP